MPASAANADRLRLRAVSVVASVLSFGDLAVGRGQRSVVAGLALAELVRVISQKNTERSSDSSRIVWSTSIRVQPVVNGAQSDIGMAHSG
jgi:hypothetical protein